MHYDEGERRALPCGREPNDFLQQARGFVPAPKPGRNMPQERQREGVARKAESLLEGGDSFLGLALAPGRPAQHEMRLKGIRE